MIDDTQIDPVVGGEEETPVAPMGDDTTEAAPEAAPVEETGDEAAA